MARPPVAWGHGAPQQAVPSLASGLAATPSAQRLPRPSPHGSEWLYLSEFDFCAGPPGPGQADGPVPLQLGLRPPAPTWQPPPPALALARGGDFSRGAVGAASAFMGGPPGGPRGGSALHAGAAAAGAAGPPLTAALPPGPAAPAAAAGAAAAAGEAAAAAAGAGCAAGGESAGAARVRERWREASARIDGILRGPADGLLGPGSQVQCRLCGHAATGNVVADELAVANYRLAAAMDFAWLTCHELLDARTQIRQRHQAKRDEVRRLRAVIEQLRTELPGQIHAAAMGAFAPAAQRATGVRRDLDALAVADRVDVEAEERALQRWDWAAGAGGEAWAGFGESLGRSLAQSWAGFDRQAGAALPRASRPAGPLAAARPSAAPPAAARPGAAPPAAAVRPPLGPQASAGLGV